MIEYVQYLNAGLLKRHIEMRFSNFIPKDGQYEAFKKAKEYPKKFIESKEFIDPDNVYSRFYLETGLLLCGAVGSGKTHLACAILNEIADNTSDKTLPFTFKTVAGLLSEIKNTYNNRESEKNIIGLCKDSPLLILDDLGVERVSDWAIEILYEIVNHRYCERIPIIITTNAQPEELKATYGTRIYDRLREMCILVPINTESQRKTADDYSVVETTKTERTAKRDKFLESRGLKPYKGNDF